MAMTGLSSATYTSVLSCWSGGTAYGFAESASMVTTPGVANSSSAGDSPAALYLSGVSTRDSAFSVFAAYPQLSQEAIRSSPASVATMNSTEPDPPIAPEWASTWMVLRSQRP